MTDFSYIGSELELFQHATNWKKYYASLIRPFFGTEVLEVGAGIGATTQALCAGGYERWICLEPDKNLAAEIDAKLARGELPKYCQTMTVTLAEMEAEEKFDSIIYIDVLEHIEHDAEEIRAAARHLKDGGHLIILSPAHQFLYTPFDKAIGHYRRYNKKTLSAVIPAELETVRLIYLDSIGAFASLANKIALQQSMPTLKQILLWDRKLVPVSTFFDPLIRHYVGKTIVGVWRKTAIR
jgi:SAM-dependent methyltransferase